MMIENPAAVDISDNAIYIIYKDGKTTKDIAGREFQFDNHAAKVIYHDGQYDEKITLADILRDYPTVVMVIVDSDLSGKVYRYGNHGPYFEQVGTTIGYA